MRRCNSVIFTASTTPDVRNCQADIHMPVKAIIYLLLSLLISKTTAIVCYSREVSNGTVISESDRMDFPESKHCLKLQMYCGNRPLSKNYHGLCHNQPAGTVFGYVGPDIYGFCSKQAKAVALRVTEYSCCSKDSCNASVVGHSIASFAVRSITAGAVLIAIALVWLPLQ